METFYQVVYCLQCRERGPLAGQLQEGRDGLHPVSRRLRIGAVVEATPNPGHRQSGKWAAAVGQPRGARNHGLLPDNQPWSIVYRSGTQTSGSPAEEQAEAVRASLPQGKQARGKRLVNDL